MKKNKLMWMFWVSMFFLTSCGHNYETIKNTTTITVVTNSGENDFDKFLTYFKPLPLENLNELSKKFNNHYLANDDSLIKLPEIYKKHFPVHLYTKSMYYGFITKLPNNSLILTFLQHFSTKNKLDDLVLDTTYFVSHVFDDKGAFQCSFRSFGSNLAGEPPTYNMTSTFRYDNDKLLITNYEYSIGNSYSDAMLIPGSDSIYQANVVTTSFYLDFKINEIVAIDRYLSKIKVVEVTRNPLPVYLKPID